MLNSTERFMAIEGLEGAGKSTIIHHIKHHIQEHYPETPVIFTREPGGTAISEKIRDILSSEHSPEILLDKTETLLMYASRYQHTETLIKPALAAGKWVICDRFHWSSFAYQGGGRGLGLSYLQQLDQLILEGFTPGISLYLDIAPKVGFKRISNRAYDRIESEKISFFERAREIYKTLINTSTNPAYLIDAEPDESEVTQEVLEIIDQWME